MLSNTTDVLLNIDKNKMKIENIKSITPLYIDFNNNKINIATVKYLCKNEEDKLFILNRNIIYNDKDDRLRLKWIPFAENELDFYSRKINIRTLSKSLPNYITYNLSADIDTVNDMIDIICFDASTKEQLLCKLSLDKYISIKYIDNYIFEDIDDEYSLTIATVSASKEGSNKSNLFIVDDLEVVDIKDDSKVSLIDKIKNKIFGIEIIKNKNLILKCNRTITDKEETYLIINATDTVYNEYAKKDNCYLSYLDISDVKFMNATDVFRFFRAQNTNNSDIKLFAINYTLLDKFKELL